MKLTSIFPQLKTDKIESKKTTDKTAAAEAAGKPETLGSDRVELSTHSRDVQKMQAILETTPETRAERIQELKTKIDNGEYNVDPKAVAEKMLSSLISDNSSE